MKQKLDKLGRKIPVFDRSAAAVKANKTNKEKYGTDYHKRIGTSGGHKRTRGYFGHLKDQGKIDELKTISKEAAAKSAANRAKKSKTERQGDTPVSGGR